MFKRLGSNGTFTSNIFKRSVTNESLQNDESEPTADKGQRKIYVTSLKNITANSRTSWSGSPPSSPLSPARRALRRLLGPKAAGDGPILPLNPPLTDEPDMISDSISSSKRLQRSILELSLEECKDARGEVRYCQRDEAGELIRALQWKAGNEVKKGKFLEALYNLNRSLALQQKLYGRKNTRVAGTLNKMGEVLSNMGEDQKYMAMSALEESLAIRQDLEPGSEDMAATLKNLWLLLHDSNVAINNTSEGGETVVFQDFDSDSSVY